MLAAHPTPESPRVALVTGATSGIGEACVRRFYAEGWHVIGWGRRKERLEALGAELGERFLAQVLDVRDREAMAAALASLPEPWAAIDVLVNNAGLALGLEKAPEADLAQWDTMIDTNCRAVVALTRAVLPGMVARRRGHVVTIGSVAANYPYPGGNVYGATKAFVHQFMLNLRADLLGTPVRATVIEPGMVETEFSKVRFGGDESRASKTYEGMDPMTGADIANAVFFCAALPPHVNVNVLELMPTGQAFSPFAVDRTGGSRP
jgi:NADP-dependent 3-hydroxy acid dehydrogenase YdfG